MAVLGRYLRLWSAFGRYGLIRELAFRTNFLVKITVEVLWLSILLVFYDTVFAQTDLVAGWERNDYLFFVGCYFTIGGLMETLFLENCNEFADLVRSGDLDFYLLKPIDEQFLVSCRNIDWSCVPNVLMGTGVMIFALIEKGWSFDVLQLFLFVAMLVCGVALAYGFMLMLTSASVWFMRNQSLYEVWWLFSTLMRYPREVFRGWADPVAAFFYFVVPIMLVSNMPARVMVRVIDPVMLAYTLFAAAVVLFVSRRFFRYALRRYRSASS